MLYRFSTTKQPQEERTYTFDLSGLKEIQRGEVLTSVTVTTDAGITVIRAEVSNPHASVRLSGGVNGVTYNVRVLVVTNAAHRIEIDLTVRVVEL